jgi:ribosomal-protein-alanine N-acetyltransferase
LISPAPALLCLPVETAGHDQLDDVMGVMGAAFDPRYGESWTLLQCSGILPMPGVTLKIARKKDGTAAGFALFRTIADESELLLLAVHPNCRRTGVGTALLEDFLNSARRAGACRVHLEMRENNPAIRMYSSAGFAQVGRRRNYYSGEDGTRFDALTLSRSV